MYRKVEDFLADWSNASAETIKVLESLTDDKLGQSIVEGHSTLGWLGWHLATAPSFFAGLVGLNVEAAGAADVVPTKADDIVEAYKKAAEDVKHEAQQQLTDEKLIEEVDHFGTPAPRGAILRTFVDHQTHHRGQMTVLLRQAGLPVPGVMGPTKEQQEQ
ncbi:DinB family protein [Salinibacillus xinjiangensis]|uniref:Damage-inducible protein DinB n=1 Tax=Salinibacillus xinjiangensis TaxID=1229268 RepID=A0A6G1X813_9BACI|nr:DinB family protein [Salinibacillus xinjiangensis]MRG87143.1 damage-inducible protein DinB [Salinibacillus xinjiangensis]